jgi:hypothetical protein
MTGARERLSGGDSRVEGRIGQNLEIANAGKNTYFAWRKQLVISGRGKKV